MNPASIAYALTAARENARRAREIVSTELWETLNTTNARMPRRLQIDKVHEFFQWVRERAALAVGIVDSSTSRDEAWQFFTLGRSIERADMTARLLATRSLTEASGPSWTTILRSCGAYEAYLRTYRGHAERAQRRRVPAAGPPVPALDHLLDPAGRGVHERHRPARGSRRALQHRAAGAGSDPQRPRVPAGRARSSASCRCTCTACRRSPARRPRRSASGSSRRRPSRAGSERSHDGSTGC